MQALVISHDPSEEAALVGARLEHHGYALDAFVVCDAVDDPVSHRPFPELDGVDLVVAMGSPWSVYDTDRIGSWIGRELEFVRAVHDRGLPYLGVCFGAQVLAAALGGTVERAPRPELGWVSIETVAPDLIASGPWFQWHRDRFTVPPGGTALAHNDVGVQAFRIGQSVGVQFHPEVDTLLLRSWLADDGTPPDPLFFELDVDPRAVLADAASIERTGWRNTHRLIDRFLEPASFW